MVPHTYLPRQHGALAHGARAGDSGQRHHDDVLADVAVVADVDEVIDLDAASNARRLKCSAVDGGVGANFDIVFEGECSLLRKLRVLSSQ